MRLSKHMHTYEGSSTEHPMKRFCCLRGFKKVNRFFKVLYVNKFIVTIAYPSFFWVDYLTVIIYVIISHYVLKYLSSFKRFQYLVQQLYLKYRIISYRFLSYYKISSLLFLFKKKKNLRPSSDLLLRA